MIKYIAKTISKHIFKKKKITPSPNYLKDYQIGDSGWNSDIHSINAYFTCFVDYEHSGFFNLKNVEKDYKSASMYFGFKIGDELKFEGIQAKNLYRLVEFITVNKLWPDASRSVIPSGSDDNLDYGEGPTFKCVVDALDAVAISDRHEDIGKAFRSYPLGYLYIAYEAVKEIGVENLIHKQPAITGCMAMKRIHSATNRKGIRIIKRLVGVGILLAVFLIFSSILTSISNLNI